MATFLVRIELPDRPGALGAVASRIGAVRGDVVSIEILRRQDGRALDEFVVELADADHVPLLLVEIAEVDGVSVETVYPVAAGVTDQRLDAYDTAAAILEERAPHGVLSALATRTCHELDASWVAIIDGENHMVIASAGRPPAARWLAAHIRESTGREPDDGDIVWVHLAAWDLMLVVGRPTWPLGARDRTRLHSLARLADARWIDLSEREARLSHPSHTG
ncbi:MAG TPA: ACT domain-containing protein [Acidimicrobiales bacterium]|nr:ACT domain-containing protein [Acidimicrobiales bacterium]